MLSAPGFTDKELHQIREFLTQHYGKDVEILSSHNQTHLSPASTSPTSCPTIFWQENCVNFLVLKSNSSEYRTQFFTTPLDQHDTGTETYCDLEECLKAILQAQSDHENA
ncbi:MAG: hypothetical protein GKR96_00735 [Gammaproteobacteria bacterium]|nr:hypothetical protein [Gammaproteobacteria bacterium]